jgi:CHASE2 domain-containing sensor protein
VTYLDLDVRIDDKTAAGYAVRAEWKNGQSEKADYAAIDATVPPLEALLAPIEADSSTRQNLCDLGTHLYQAVFCAGKRDIEAFLEQAYGGAATDVSLAGVRIRLRLGPAEIAALPWELLYSQRRDHFFGTTPDTVLLRFVELRRPVRPLKARSPLRMLVVIPDSDLDVVKERDALKKALEKLEGRLVQTQTLEGRVTFEALNTVLRRDEFHLLHFIGHGRFEKDEPFLVLNGEAGGEDLVSQRRMSALVEGHPTVKLVVLNSCEGARLSSSRPLVGMAAGLVRAGVPAVIAMQFAIDNDQATLFASEFYGSLFDSRWAGWVEVALGRARGALGRDFEGDRVVGAPVLFLRGPDGILFDVKKKGWNLPLSPERRATARGLARILEHDVEIDREQPPEEISSARQSIAALSGVRRRLRFGGAALIGAALAAAVILVLRSLYVFDLLPPELKVESYAVWIGAGLRPPTFDGRLRVLPVSEETYRQLTLEGDFGPWRRYNARLIDVLSAARARVIAFDVFYERGTAADPVLVRAIQDAAGRGTTVVLGARALEGAAPLLAPALRDSPAAWGALCAGRRGVKSVSLIPLLTTKDAPRITVPALSLSALAAYQDRRPVDIDPQRAAIRLLDREGSRITPLAVSWVETVAAHSDCPAVARGDRTAEMVVDTVPLDVLRDPRRTLRVEPAAIGVPGPPLDIAGAIVLVGVATAADRIDVLRGLSLEKHYGYEVHAEALNTLLQGIVVRPLALPVQIALTLAMALAGGLLRAPVLNPRPRTRLALLGAAAAGYLAAAVWAYASRRLMLNMLYDLGALFLAYALLGKFRRWWP